MSDLVEGLYDRLVGRRLADGLVELDPVRVERRPLRPADAADRIALHLARQVERAIESLSEKDRVRVGGEVVQRFLSELAVRVPGVDVPLLPIELLSAIHGYNPDGSVRRVAEPLIPLLDTTLLTNSPGEPRLQHQLGAEIGSADRVDMVVAFVRRSGLLPLRRALKTHAEAGRPIRVLTTTYTGSTEARALSLLRDIGAEVRVSYDTTSTRLHAKAWLFHRATGFSTAYVGSSNLTYSAQVDGLEWNVRISAARNRDTVDKLSAVFDAYWESGDFEPYDAERFAAETRTAARDGAAAALISPVEIRLEPFQERLLELVELARGKGLHENLIVAATGTGKTVMAAVDYARLRRRSRRSRLLFVAHREEILDQSLATFRHALRDATFGEKWVGGRRPRDFDHVFASIQSLNANGLDKLDPGRFDVVVVDEFHHAAAASYARLLETVRPRELLGLTATPERADGLPILQWFGGRISAELRLWDAIDQHRLTPFAYYGVSDGTDLTGVTWRRGSGYDVTELSNVYTGESAWARLVIDQTAKHVDISTMRCLGFCVSVDHATFMADRFTHAGIRAVAVHAGSSGQQRRQALDGLASGAVRAVFSVDVFNEGIDVPSVDTVLLMRPTESGTLFLQQLGRGLRRERRKTVCTVLDFIGTHRAQFRYDLRYRALLGGTRRDVELAVLREFPFLPSGCHMELDRVASAVVLRSIRDALPSGWRGKVAELRSVAAKTGEVSLATFLDETGLDLEDVYANGRTWSDLRVAAGLPVRQAGPAEAQFRRALGRMLHIDDSQRIDAYHALLGWAGAPDAEQLRGEQRLLARMLLSSMASRGLRRGSSLQEGLELLWDHPQVLAELSELLAVLSGRINHLHTPAMPEVPLQVHARYTRTEILAAVGAGDGVDVPEWREGVFNAGAIGADILAFTLDKSNGDFSPTTRYRDYAISRELVHWESQSTTRADSPTGRRYRNHVALGRSVLLFGRERNDQRAFYCLGPATYVGHAGERPMAVTWRLATPLPGDLFQAFAAAVA